MRESMALIVLILVLASVFAGGIVVISGMAGKTAGSGSGTGLNSTSRHVILPKAATQANASEKIVLDPGMILLANSMGQLKYSSQNITVDVTHPPLVIDLTITPKEITDTKWYINRSLSKHDEIVQVSRTSEGAFLDLAVYDQTTGKIVARDGFGRTYSIDEHKRIEVYQPGKFRVNLYGNEVSVKSVLSMKQPGIM